MNCFLLDGEFHLQNGEPLGVSVTDTWGEEGSHGCQTSVHFSSMAPGLMGLLFLSLSLSRISANTACFAKFPTITCDSGTPQGEKATKKGLESLALREKVELSQYMTLGL